MDIDNVIDEIEWWLHESIDEEEAPKDGFYVEKYEHAAIIRWGSIKRDFPTLGMSSLLGETHIIISGVKDGATIISDVDAETTIDVEQLAYKHFLETLMVFKIRVERIKPKDA